MAKAKKATAKTANRAAKRAADRRVSRIFKESLKTAEGELLLRMTCELCAKCLEVFPEQSEGSTIDKWEPQAGVFNFAFELRTAESRFEIVIRPGVFEFYRVDATAPPGKTPGQWCCIMGRKPVVVEWADPEFEKAVAGIISEVMGRKFPSKWFKYDR